MNAKACPRGQVRINGKCYKKAYIVLGDRPLEHYENVKLISNVGTLGEHRKAIRKLEADEETEVMATGVMLLGADV